MKSAALIWILFFSMIALLVAGLLSEVAAAMHAHADQINNIDSILNRS